MAQKTDSHMICYDAEDVALQLASVFVTTVVSKDAKLFNVSSLQTGIPCVILFGVFSMFFRGIAMIVIADDLLLFSSGGFLSFHVSSRSDSLPSIVLPQNQKIVLTT